MEKLRQRTILEAPRGFTMVELLVAVALSSLSIVALFYLMTTMSRSFRAQNDLSQMTDRMNYAIDTIKNDLRRASFLTVPNAYLPASQYPWYRSVCAPPTWLAEDGAGATAHAIFHRHSTSNAFYAPRQQDRPARAMGPPDRIVLLGAYRTTEPFRPTQMSSGTNFLRVANNGRTDQEMSYIFDDAFVAVTAPEGGTQYLRVGSVRPHDTLPETILVFTSALLADPTLTGSNPNCDFTGFGSGLFEVVPLHFVRYSVMNDPDSPDETVLVREELDWAMGDLDTVSRYVVARNIVDLQIWFDGVASGGIPTNVIDDGETAGNWVDDDGSVASTQIAGDGASEPENARFAYVQISGRLETVLAQNIDEGDNDNLRDFIELRRFDGSNYHYTGDFTRVVTMRTEVEMPNMNLANTRTGL